MGYGSSVRAGLEGPADATELAEEFVSRHYTSPRNGYTLRYWRGGFYYWLGGAYSELSVSSLEAGIVRFVQLRNAVKTCAVPVRITKGLVRDVIVNLAGYVKIHDLFEPYMMLTDPEMDHLIAFSDGVLCYRRRADGRIETPLDATPNFFTFSCLPYKYLPDAQCPLWLKFLDEVMEGDAERIELLQQWCGYLLIHSMELQKFMLLCGEGANGKSTFIGVVERLVGLDNASHVPLCMFGDRFALYSTLGKKLNSTSESSGRIDPTAEMMLKSLTSGDRMTFDRKNRDAVHTYPTAKVMISTNQLPSFSDSSNGLWRRMLYVPFDATIPMDKQDMHLPWKLAKELSGIFNWALKGLWSVDDRRRFTEPRKCRQALEQYRRDCSPARTFLQDCCAAALPSASIPCATLYQRYCRWCEDNGYRPMSSGNFGKEVKRVYPASQRTKIQLNGERGWCYTSIFLTDDVHRVPYVPG